MPLLADVYVYTAISSHNKVDSRSKESQSLHLYNNLIYPCTTDIHTQNSSSKYSHNERKSRFRRSLRSPTIRRKDSLVGRSLRRQPRSARSANERHPETSNREDGQAWSRVHYPLIHSAWSARCVGCQRSWSTGDRDQ